MAILLQLKYRIDIGFKDDCLLNCIRTNGRTYTAQLRREKKLYLDCKVRSPFAGDTHLTSVHPLCRSRLVLPWDVSAETIDVLRAPPDSNSNLAPVSVPLYGMSQTARAVRRQTYFPKWRAGLSFDLEHHSTVSHVRAKGIGLEWSQAALLTARAAHIRPRVGRMCQRWTESCLYLSNAIPGLIRPQGVCLALGQQPNDYIVGNLGFSVSCFPLAVEEVGLGMQSLQAMSDDGQPFARLLEPAVASMKIHHSLLGWKLSILLFPGLGAYTWACISVRYCLAKLEV